MLQVLRIALGLGLAILAAVGLGAALGLPLVPRPEVFEPPIVSVARAALPYFPFLGALGLCAVAVAEHWRLPHLIYWLLAGCVIAMLGYHALQASGAASAALLAQPAPLKFVIMGAFGGFVHWLVAGRQAGSIAMLLDDGRDLADTRAAQEQRRCAICVAVWLLLGLVPLALLGWHLLHNASPSLARRVADGAEADGAKMLAEAGLPNLALKVDGHTGHVTGTVADAAARASAFAKAKDVLAPLAGVPGVVAVLQNDIIARDATDPRVAEENARIRAAAEADARKKAEEERLMAEAEAKRKAAEEEARRKAEEERLAAAVAAKRKAAEEEARKKAEEERLASEAEKQLAEIAAKRKALEEEQIKAETERLAQIEAERKQQESTARAKAAAEAEAKRKAAEEEASQRAEAERQAAEIAAKRKAVEEAQVRAEAKRLAQIEAERKQKEAEEQAKAAAAEEARRRAEEAEAQQRAEAERQVAEIEAKRKAAEDAQIKAEAERLAQIEAERREQEAAAKAKAAVEEEAKRKADGAAAAKDESALQSCETQLEEITEKRKIFFKSASSELRKIHAKILDAVAALSKRCINMTIIVSGHTDFQGDEQANQQLSEERAEAVRAALVERGVDSKQLEVRGYAWRRPSDGTMRKTARASDRRAEFMAAPRPAGANAGP